MTKIANLTVETDPVRAAEIEHEGSKLALRISPLATFLLEAGLQPRLRNTSKTRAATTLFEAALQDWAASQGIDLESEEFKRKYLRWLTRQPYTAEYAAAMGDEELLNLIEQGHEVYPEVTL